MGTVRVVLREKPNSQGAYPIAIRITANRRSSYIYTGQYIEKKYWDSENRRVKKSHSNSARLNNLINAKIADANDKLLEHETSESITSVESVKKQIKNEAQHSFFDLAETYLSSIKQAGKYTRYSADKSRVKHFKDFLKQKDIDFKDINEILLRRFQAYLKEVRQIGERTIVNHLIVIRTIFNLAIRQGSADPKYYPFGKGKVVIRFPESIKIGLDRDEIARLENLDLPHGPKKHALNIWLFSYYLAGMRVSDVLRLRWSDIQSGRLFYSMGKNSKAGSLKIPRKAIEILNQYEAMKQKLDDVIFPELKNTDFSNPTRVQKDINNADKKFNNHLEDVADLAEIEKKITMHIARHTFGNLSGDEIPIQMLQKLYRHTSVLTTINYQSNFIHRDADEALEKVIK